LRRAIITAYDLNKPAIKWQVGIGDDPKLAASGIMGTGITQMAATRCRASREAR